MREKIFHRIENAPPMTWIQNGTNVLVLFVLTFIFLYYIKRLTYLFAFLIIFIVILAEFYLIIFSLEVSNPELIGSAVLGLFAAIYFLSQMIVNIETNIFEQSRREKSSRQDQTREFTLTLVLEARSDHTLNWHRANLHSVLPPGVRMDPKTHHKIRSQKERFKYKPHTGPLPDRAPVHDSILFLLNYYEFVATGIRTGVINQKIIELTMGNIIYQFVAKVRPLMDEQIEKNKEDLRNQARARGEDDPPPDDHVYSDLKNLIEKWREGKVWFARDIEKPSDKTNGSL